VFSFVSQNTFLVIYHGGKHFLECSVGKTGKRAYPSLLEGADSGAVFQQENSQCVSRTYKCLYLQTANFTGLVQTQERIRQVSQTCNRIYTFQHCTEWWINVNHVTCPILEAWLQRPFYTQVSCGLNMKSPPGSCIEHMVVSWWCYLGSMWGLSGHGRSLGVSFEGYTCVTVPLSLLCLWSTRRWTSSSYTFSC
jgi:hypothetical protein